MEFDMESILPVFLADSEDGLTTMEEALVALESRPDDAEAVGEIFRVVHTLKGDAGSLGFTGLATLAHHLEDLLDELREGRRRVDTPGVSLLLRATDVLRDQLTAAARGSCELAPAHRALLAEIVAAVGERLPAAAARPGRAAAESPVDRDDSPARRHLRSTVRVGLDKLDRLLDLTGEIAVTRGRLQRLLADPASPRAALAAAHLEVDAMHHELQELVMALRMVPVGPTFRRYLRTVRDLARELGKEAELVIAEGAEVEVDSSALQALREPLLHMLRNAVDHGIETPEVRRAAGKEPCGRITLTTRHQAGSIVIELADDGAGLDRRRILARARDLGLIAAGEELADRDVDQLIFAPGLSTTRGAPTELSGRGVGMDVVGRTVAALRGGIEVVSRPGRGTTVALRLPLTLAIVDALLLGLAGETYAVPLEAVVELVELPAAGDRRGDAEGLFRLRDDTLPYVRLRHLFRLDGEPPRREYAVVVQTAGGGRAGLVVDALQGQGQTVIKPLAPLFRGVPGLAASAILGNGRAVFVLDVEGLLRLARSPAVESAAGGER